MALNCNRMGEIFSQLAKLEIILNCSSEERSAKLMGSTSKIFRYRPSVVSTTPFRMSRMGRKDWADSPLFFFLLGLFGFVFFFAIPFYPPKVEFAPVSPEPQDVSQILK